VLVLVVVGVIVLLISVTAFDTLYPPDVLAGDELLVTPLLAPPLVEPVIELVWVELTCVEALGWTDELVVLITVGAG
jgi:hypothetical protein